MSPEEADRHELSEALAQLDEHQPGEALGTAPGVDHAALSAALGGEAGGAPGGESDHTTTPTSPPVLAPVPDPPPGATPALELDWPTEGEQLVIEDEPPRRGLFVRAPRPGDESTDPEVLAQQGIRRRNWILVALATLVAAAVLAFLAARASDTSKDPAVVAASREESTDAAPAAAKPPGEPRQITPDVVELLTLLGLSAEQIAAVDGGPLIDAGEGDALADQPRIEQAGTFLLTLDADAVRSLFGTSGEAPCGTHNDLHGAAFQSACTTTVREPAPGTYFLQWVDTGESYLAPQSTGASIRASIDTNADGAVDIPANVISKGAEGVELTDGATGLGTQALVLGTAMAFLVPVNENATPQWAYATAATTGQLSDIIDWQRWVIEPEGARRAAPAIYGVDVRP